MAERKIVQIAAMAASAREPSALVALADDGTVWQTYAPDCWRRIAPLPQGNADFTGDDEC